MILGSSLFWNGLRSDCLPTNGLIPYNSLMSTPLDEYALDFLDDDARRLVKDMLKAVVEHSDIYSNGFSVQRQRDGSFEYFLGKHGRPGPFTNSRRLPHNITDALVFHGIAGPKVNPQWPESFRSFTDAALDWQRRYGGPDADEVRKRIGRILRRQVGDRPREYRIEEVATEVGVSVDRVRKQTHVLLGVGLVERMLSGDMEFGVLGLTEPAGLFWAEGRFPPIHSLGSQTINVNLDLRFEIHNIIEQARAAEIPENLLLQFEARLKRVQEELEKPQGQGRFQRVRELMEFAANIKEVAPLAAGFVAAHGDKIHGFVDAAGDMIP